MLAAKNAIAFALFVASSAAVHKAPAEDWCYHGFGCQKPSLHMNCAPNCINWAQWCAWNYQNMGGCYACGLLVQNGESKPCEGICAGCQAGPQTGVANHGSHAETTMPPVPTVFPTTSPTWAKADPSKVCTQYGGNRWYPTPKACCPGLVECKENDPNYGAEVKRTVCLTQGCKWPTSSPLRTDAPTFKPTAAVTGDKLSVKGDPFVVDSHGNKVQFFMPLFTEQELLRCAEWTLWGKAFGTGISNDHQQWFHYFRMQYEGNQSELEVSIAENQTSVPDEADISAPLDAAKDLSVLDMKIAGVKVTKTGAVASDNNCLAAIWKTAAAETLQFSCGGTVLQIKSALAQKFDEEKKQRLYTHLDLRFLELQSASCKGGILAEIWGFSPMSKRTAEMLQPPKN